jgi:SAM-dependent methyltransferase
MNQQMDSCSIACNLCGGKEIVVLSNVSRSGKPLRAVICKSCGLVWLDPRPFDAREFYEKEYRVAYKSAYTPKPKHIVRAGKVALSRLDKIRQLFPASKAILDVGTGGGEFAYLLQSLGHKVSGVEPNRGYADYSVKEYDLKVQLGFVQECAFLPESFDVITIWHVLEHTENPGAVLALLRSWLKSDGILVVEVPNIEATCQSPKSTFHEAHLYYFNLATLSGLAEKNELYVDWHTMSSDGGNMTVFLRRKASLIPPSSGGTIHGNFERICTIVRAHTSFRHSLRLTPYFRALQRFRRALTEQAETASFRSGKHLLDSLYTLTVALTAKSTMEHKDMVQ